MTSSTETLTVQLPAAAAHRLRRVAALAGRPVDEVIADTLNATLPPLLEDVPLAFHADLAHLETLSNEALHAQLQALVPPDNVMRADALQALRAQQRPWPEVERQEWDTLQTEADRLMFRKAYAAVLLKWRGERIPSVAELPSPVS
jgi:hypothetical protein